MHALSCSDSSEIAIVIFPHPGVGELLSSSRRWDQVSTGRMQMPLLMAEGQGISTRSSVTPPTCIVFLGERSTHPPTHREREEEERQSEQKNYRAASVSLFLLEPVGDLGEAGDVEEAHCSVEEHVHGSRRYLRSVRVVHLENLREGGRAGVASLFVVLCGRCDVGVCCGQGQTRSEDGVGCGCSTEQKGREASHS